MPAESSRAVFLSYASQDAEAARRICDALRAAGVEVWFDQSELRGGDAWDQKIRRQIKECALFVPIISANTQARLEGYFRLEWLLAVERSRLMAQEKSFLLPVVIDDTADAVASVPDKFREVQWTRLTADQSPRLFCDRVQALLSGERGPPRPADATRPERPGAAAVPGRRAPLGWIAGAVAVLAIGALLIWPPWRKPSPAAPSTPAAGAAHQAAGSEIARLRGRIVPSRWGKSDFDTGAATVNRLIQANPEDADAWALRSILHSLLVVRQRERSTKPLEIGKADAERALRVAPDSPLASLALGMHHLANVSRGGDPQAARAPIDRAVARLPPDSLTRYAELVSYWFGYDFENTARCARAWIAAEPEAIFPVWLMASASVASRRPDEAAQWAERAAVDQNFTNPLVTLAECHFHLRADPAASRAALERIPLASRSDDRAVFVRWLVNLAENRWDEALQDLAQAPNVLLFDARYGGPKALLAGIAHQRAGRPDAAAVHFREAERLLREQLSTDADNETLRLTLAVTLASAGRGSEARAELAVVEPLIKGRPASVFRSQFVGLLAQTHAALGDHAAMAFWLRKIFSEPSSPPLTPASVRLDPRYNPAVNAPEIQALLKEFAALDHPPAAPSKVDQKSAPAEKSASAEKSAPAAKSVAVLPFANMSPDPENAFFADGVHEDVITNLAKIRDLKVISRTSTLAYRDAAQRNLRRIAEELGVAAVLEGSVRRAGSKVRVTAQLIDARTDQHLWAETYNEDLSDIFAVQAKLAQEIASALKANLTSNERRLIERRPTENAEAYDLYVRGRATSEQATTRPVLEAQVALYEQAIAKDPTFALAHVQLSLANGSLYWFASMDPTPARQARVRTALDAAQRLAPDLPETRMAVGDYAYKVENDWARALAEFRAAEAGMPNDAQVANFIANANRRLGRLQEAVTAFARSAELNPRSVNVPLQQLFTLRTLRRFRDVRTLGTRYTAAFPNHQGIAYLLALARLELEHDVRGYLDRVEAGDGIVFSERTAPAGRYWSALLRGDFAAAERALADPQLTFVVGADAAIAEPIVFHRALLAYLRGQHAEARELADAAIAMMRSEPRTPRQVPAMDLNIALAHALAGRSDEAVALARDAFARQLAHDAFTASAARPVLARVFLVLGRDDDAWAVLREMMTGPCHQTPAETRLDPFWSRLKDDPRFEEILKSAQPL